MKKSLFFSLVIAGALTACNNDEVSNPQIDNSNDPVEIRLSASSSPIVVTKSAGTIGDIDGQEGNKWNNQTIYIYSYLKTETDFSKPSYLKNKEAKVQADGSILWTNGKNEYFPPLSAYNFFGYYADDTVNPADTISKDGKVYFENVMINGSQDLMLAKAELTADQKASLLEKAGLADASEAAKLVEWNKAFSAYTARREVQPNMIFKHLLARLQFKIYPGKDGAEVVYIKQIKVKSRATGKLVIVAENDADRGFIIDSAIDPINLSLKERDSKGLMVDLVQQHYNTPAFGEKGDDGTQKGNQVGESLLVAPQESYDISIVMEQNIGSAETPEWKELEFPTTLKLSTAEGVAKPFLAGYSYLVKVTVFGLQPVGIETVLLGWQAGDDVILNPDDEF